MSQLTSRRLAVLGAVIAHQEANQRIPRPQRPGVTYFSVHDTWLFQAVMDNRTCDLCLHYEVANEWRGDQLRTEFPYLEIVDELTIKANVHPNCRCYLMRKTGS